MKLNHFSAMLIAAITAAACQPQTPDFKPALEVNGITLTEDAVSADATGANITFTVNSNIAYTVTADKEWVKASPSSVENADKKDIKKTITLTVEPNTVEEARTATVKIAAEGNASLDYTFTVRQGAAKFDKSLEVLTTGLAPITEAIAAGASENTVSVMVVSTVSWTASSSASWLTVDPASMTIENYEETPAAVKFNIGANTATEAREATVTFKGEGVDPVAVKVNQTGKVIYTIDVKVSDITATTASVTYTPSDENIHYLLSCEKASYVEQFDTDEELVAADMEYFEGAYGSSYGNYGFDSYESLFLNGLCATGTYKWDLDDMDPETRYVAYTFAVDENLNVVSDVFKKEFTTLESTASDAYKAWLGSYVLKNKSFKTGADTTYNVSLAMGVGDKTILLNGLGVDGIPLAWNSADNTCTVTFGQFASNSRFTFYASGITNDNYVCTGDPETGAIATMTKNENNEISISNVVYSLTEERTEVYAIYWGILGTDGQGWYTFNDVDYVVNPATMSPAASSSSKSVRPLKKGLFTALTPKIHPVTIANCVELR